MTHSQANGIRDPIQGLMRTPRSVNIELTSRCNLRCRYCYFFNNPAVTYRDLPTEDWLRFFDELGALGVMNVSLAGGEPFTRTDLPLLLEGVVRNHMRFSLISNGSLIDDKIAAFIAATGRCDHVQVSVDGSRPETHDANRGRGSFEGAIRGIRTLQRHGVKVAVRLTITQHNVNDLEDAARFLLEELELPGFGTNSAGYLGTCQINAKDLLLTTAQRQTAMETLLRLNEKYHGRISAAAGPLAEGRMWGKMEAARRAGAPPFAHGGKLFGCGCVWNKISIRADGAVMPCSMLAHEVLGYINQDKLVDIWQKSPVMDRMRNRRNISLNNFEFCSGCAYQPYCTGNCPGLAYALTGQIDHPSPDACLRKFLQDGGSLEGIIS
jgi:SynChlorMet cassette radical SAM/SPASM protein ScmE